MPGSCCAKPVARIIKVAEFEAGLVGLDQALRNVYICSGYGISATISLHRESMITKKLCSQSTGSFALR